MHTPGPLTVEQGWTDYATEKPPEAGVYRWRMHNKAIGMQVEFDALFRERGAGYESVLSPDFDYWDGYRVHVPSCEWKSSDQERSRRIDERIHVVGLDLLPCPFCGDVPKWKAVQRATMGGVICPGYPHKYNSWNLDCCRWNDLPWCDDPRELHKHHSLVAMLKDLIFLAQSVVGGYDCAHPGAYRQLRDSAARILAKLPQPNGESHVEG